MPNRSGNTAAYHNCFERARPAACGVGGMPPVVRDRRGAGIASDRAGAANTAGAASAAANKSAVHNRFTAHPNRQVRGGRPVP